MGEPLRVAIVGCGMISGAYVATTERLPGVRFVAVTDVNADLADAAAQRLGVPSRTFEQVLADPEVDAVLNLTPPQLHGPLSIAALEAGKHVYVEKPFAATPAEADAMLAAAARHGVRVGSAPDTVLGTGIQTARQLLDAGAIGRPIAATSIFLNDGFESWHPNAGFMYLEGAGPMMEMGVYYLTSLVTLFGPVDTVYGQGDRGRTERTVPEGAPEAGRVLPVEVDTYVAATMRHTSGVITTVLTSYDVVATTLPPIQVFGTTGALNVPDPNAFADPVFLSTGGEFTQVEPSAGYIDGDRGYGLADMARAIAAGAPHRQSGELGFHVNEVMTEILASCRDGDVHRIASTCERPAPVPLGATPDQA